VAGLALLIIGWSGALGSPLDLKQAGGAEGIQPAPSPFLTAGNGTGNNTGNNTGNKTAPPCTPAANDYCYINLVAISENLARFIAYASGLFDLLKWGFIALAIFVVVTEILLVRYVREKVAEAMNRKLGPEDPRNLRLAAEVGKIVVHAAPEEDQADFERRAERDAIEYAKRLLREAKRAEKQGAK